MLKFFKKIFYSLLIGIALYSLFAIFYPLSEFKYTKPELPETFDEYYQNVLAREKNISVRKGNEERLQRAVKGKSEIAILYIHGFGASREEGEYVVSRVAEKFKANCFFVRLPGHGTNKEDHRDKTFKDYLEYSANTLMMMDRLGKKIVVMGTSMGGLIATWLAANFPDKMDAVILVSPFYDFVDVSANILKLPGGLAFAEALFGEVRDTSPKNPDYSADYQKYWYTKQYYRALGNIVNLREVAANSDVYEKVSDPVLLLYYYKNGEKQDPTASVPAMLNAFEHFNENGKKNVKSKKVAIKDGNHVLLSKHIKSNKERIKTEITSFIRSTVGSK